MGHVQDADIKSMTILPEIFGDEESLEEGWNNI